MDSTRLRLYKLLQSLYEQKRLISINLMNQKKIILNELNNKLNQLNNYLKQSDETYLLNNSFNASTLINKNNFLNQINEAINQTNHKISSLNEEINLLLLSSINNKIQSEKFNSLSEKELDKLKNDLLTQIKKLEEDLNNIYAARR